MELASWLTDAFASKASVALLWHLYCLECPPQSWGFFFVHLYLVRKGRFGVEATWMIRWEGFSKWYFVRCFWMLPARSICIKLLCIAIKVRAIKIWYRCYLWNPLVSNINSVEFFEETPSLKKHGPNSFRDLHGVAVPRCWKVDIWRRTPPDSS